MTYRIAADKDVRSAIKRAERGGARIERGKSHVKVFDGEELVAVFSMGAKSGGRRHRGGVMGKHEKAFRERGW